MKQLYLVFFFALITGKTFTQSLYFPPLTGSTWQALSPDSLNWCPDKIDTLYSWLQQRNTKAFLILKDGKIVLEKYFGTFTKDSLWYWASAGKTITATMVGIAQKEGKLSINDTSSKYLGAGWTSCSAADEAKITIRHQLTMTSGLDDENYDKFCTLDSCLHCYTEPGTRWAYHNAPYTLLDDVLEGATGVTLNTYINQKLKPLTGITGLFIKSGFNNLFVSNARSMARFGLLMLNRGNWNGAAVLSDTAYYNQMVNTSQNINLSYGYLWWLNGKASYMPPGIQITVPQSLAPAAPPDMVAALGKNGQIINIVPSQNLVVVRMGDSFGDSEVPIFYNDSLWQEINKLTCSPVSSLNDLSLESYTVYPNPAKDELQIRFEGAPRELMVIDLTGRIILNAGMVTSGSYVPLTTLTPGVYYLTEGQRAVAKFVKQ